MRYAKEKVEKLCSFYVSDWHLATMLLPYINKKVDEKVEVIAILETNLKENIKVLLNKLNLKNMEKIDKIDFDKTNAYKYENIVKKIGDKLNKDYMVKTSTPEEAESVKKLIRKELNSVKIELEAVLDKKIINIQDFLSLQNNDIIILNKKCNSPIEIYIEQKLIFNGVLGLVGDNKGIKILDVYYSEEVINNEG